MFKRIFILGVGLVLSTHLQLTLAEELGVQAVTYEG